MIKIVSTSADQVLILWKAQYSKDYTDDIGPLGQCYVFSFYCD